MLSSPSIELRLNTEARDHIELCENGAIRFDGVPVDIPIVYTGALDELFGCCLGKLPYRSLSFRYETVPVPRFQPTTSVAYPLAEGYTRITEFSNLMPLPPETDKTIIVYEYPERYGTEKGTEPYYPILTKESQELYARYQELASRYPTLHYCGRLGDFKYYNMDNAVLRAVEVFEQLALGGDSGSEE